MDEILLMKEASLYDNLKLSSEIDDLKHQNAEQQKVNEVFIFDTYFKLKLNNLF